MSADEVALLVARVAIGCMGGAIGAAAVPFRRREVPRNAGYGLRTRATLADDWVWYEANARAATGSYLVAAVVILAAVIVPALPGLRHAPTIVRVLVLVALVVSIMVVDAIWACRIANRLLAERRRGAEAPSG